MISWIIGFATPDTFYAKPIPKTPDYYSSNPKKNIIFDEESLGQLFSFIMSLLASPNKLENSCQELFIICFLGFHDRFSMVIF